MRKGNPKKLRDWDDLVRPDVEVITRHPKTSTGARWGYLAAWGYAFKQPGGSETSALRFVKKLFTDIKAPDSGTRNSMMAFVEQGTGHVLLAWENEAHRVVREHGEDKFEIVIPSMSILSESAISVVDNVVDQNSARDVAKAYIDYL